MNECWINVYRSRDGRVGLGGKLADRKSAEWTRQVMRRNYGDVVLYRLHVTLKTPA